PSAAQALGLLFDAVFLDALEADAERLDRVNLLLASLPPGGPAPDGLRPVELLLLHPTRDLADLAAGPGQLLPPRVRRIVRALGGGRACARVPSTPLARRCARVRVIDRRGGAAREWRALGGVARTLEICSRLAVAAQSIALGYRAPGAWPLPAARRAARVPLG